MISPKQVQDAAGEAALTVLLGAKTKQNSKLQSVLSGGGVTQHLHVDSSPADIRDGRQRHTRYQPSRSPQYCHPLSPNQIPSLQLAFDNTQTAIVRIGYDHSRLLNTKEAEAGRSKDHPELPSKILSQNKNKVGEENGLEGKRCLDNSDSTCPQYKAPGRICARNLSS
jgi:hypothetical protein